MNRVEAFSNDFQIYLSSLFIFFRRLKYFLQKGVARIPFRILSPRFIYHRITRVTMVETLGASRRFNNRYNKF